LPKHLLAARTTHCFRLYAGFLQKPLHGASFYAFLKEEVKRFRRAFEAMEGEEK
jgi:hypothetical protein